jgi:hypothetical protein
LECEEARKNGKEVLAFIVEKSQPWPADLIDKEQSKVDCLNRFKTWIDKHCVRATFTTPDSLCSAVVASLHKWQERHRMGGA